MLNGRLIVIKHYYKFIFISILLGTLLFVVYRFSLVNTPSGDDFAFDTGAMNHTPISYAYTFFKNFTARITNIVIVGSYFEILNPFQSARLVPGISIFSSVLSFFLIIKAFTKKVSNYLSLSLSIIMNSMIMLSTISIYENFFWFPGFVTYILPGLGLASLLYIIKKGPSFLKNYYFIFLLSFVIGFINEPFNLQASIIILGIVIFGKLGGNRLSDSSKTHYYILSVSGLLLSTLIMFKAPGTTKRAFLYRQANDSSQIARSDIIKFSINQTREKSLAFIESDLAYIIIVNAVLYILLRRKNTTLFISAKKLFLVMLFTLSSIPIIFLPLGVVFSFTLSQPTFYSMITSSILIYFCSAIISIYIYGNPVMKNDFDFHENKSLLPILCLMGCAGLILFYSRYYPRALSQYSINRDLFDKLNRNRNRKKLTIPKNSYSSDKLFTYCTLNNNRSNWCNEATSKWYNIEELTVEEVN